MHFKFRLIIWFEFFDDTFHLSHKSNSQQTLNQQPNQTLWRWLADDCKAKQTLQKYKCKRLRSHYHLNSFIFEPPHLFRIQWHSFVSNWFWRRKKHISHTHYTGQQQKTIDNANRNNNNNSIDNYSVHISNKLTSLMRIFHMVAILQVDNTKSEREKKI